MSLPDSAASRRRILEALRAAPRAASPPPSLAPYLEGPFGRAGDGSHPDPASLVDTFKAAARGWRAEVIEATPASWPGAVEQALASRGCRRVDRGCSGPNS